MFLFPTCWLDVYGTAVCFSQGFWWCHDVVLSMWFCVINVFGVSGVFCLRVFLPAYLCSGVTHLLILNVVISYWC